MTITLKAREEDHRGQDHREQDRPDRLDRPEEDRRGQAMTTGMGATGSAGRRRKPAARGDGGKYHECNDQFFHPSALLVCGCFSKAASCLQVRLPPMMTLPSKITLRA